MIFSLEQLAALGALAVDSYGPGTGVSAGYSLRSESIDNRALKVSAYDAPDSGVVIAVRGSYDAWDFVGEDVQTPETVPAHRHSVR